MYLKAPFLSVSDFLELEGCNFISYLEVVDLQGLRGRSRSRSRVFVTLWPRNSLNVPRQLRPFCITQFRRPRKLFVLGEGQPEALQGGAEGDCLGLSNNSLSIPIRIIRLRKLQHT